MIDLQRFNLLVNIRDFVRHIGDAREASLLFINLQSALQVHTRPAEFVVYSAGQFKTRQRNLQHVFISDILDRISYLRTNANRDNKINMELWDKVLFIVKEEVAKEYRAYRLEHKRS